MAYLPFYPDFTAFTPSIPKFYYATESQEERILAICKEINKIIEYSKAMNGELTETEAQVEQLLEDFEKFKESGFLDYYEQLLLKFIDENGERVLGELLGFQVLFELNDDGYFVAKSPTAWDALDWDTVEDYSSEAYGRLTLLY